MADPGTETARADAVPANDVVVGGAGAAYFLSHALATEDAEAALRVAVPVAADA